MQSLYALHKEREDKKLKSRIINYFRNRDFMLDTKYTVLIITIIHQDDSHQQLMSVYLKSFSIYCSLQNQR